MYGNNRLPCRKSFPIGHAVRSPCPQDYWQRPFGSCRSLIWRGQTSAWASAVRIPDRQLKPTLRDVAAALVETARELGPSSLGQMVPRAISTGLAASLPGALTDLAASRADSSVHQLAEMVGA